MNQPMLFISSNNVSIILVVAYLTKTSGGHLKKKKKCQAASCFSNVFFSRLFA